MNLYDGELELEHEVDGFRWRATRVGERMGAELLGASLFELPPGQRTFPYHFHLGVEEWLVVVSGAPTLRAPDGERVLRAGDAVCFPEGPAGAHQLRNDSDESARVLLLSTAGGEASVALYPDSGKVGPRAPGYGPTFREADAVDYWHGEVAED